MSTGVVNFPLAEFSSNKLALDVIFRIDFGSFVVVVVVVVVGSATFNVVTLGFVSDIGTIAVCSFSVVSPVVLVDDSSFFEAPALGLSQPGLLQE